METLFIMVKVDNKNKAKVTWLTRKETDKNGKFDIIENQKGTLKPSIWKIKKIDFSQYNVFIFIYKNFSFKIRDIEILLLFIF